MMICTVSGTVSLADYDNRPLTKLIDPEVLLNVKVNEYELKSDNTYNMHCFQLTFMDDGIYAANAVQKFIDYLPTSAKVDLTTSIRWTK